ncbi:MAG: amino acid transporter [Acidobacteria bacterium RIFCSPLOWO2_02_FULL_65_29]|nr:MAG: amino acid transporter [Acidobacteria bacterium RIFCSPLOWO2_02_FULL_65_29]
MSMPARASEGAPTRLDDRAFFGHPRGLSTLFFTEMWERFSYYGMRAILILFMTAAPSAGGLGFDVGVAGAVYGLYTSMVYMTSLPGGWIADRLIGQRRAVLYGGILIASGHFSMAVPSITTFYLGLLLIVIGTGLLKPNISVLVGQLYPQGDTRRDAGFSIYYMGINTGAFFSPLVCGYLGQRVNWHLGFAAAGVGMVFGLIQYVLGDKHLGEAGARPAPTASPAEADANWRLAKVLGGGGALALVTFVLLVYAGIVPVTPTQIADAAGYLLLVTTVVFFAWLFLSGDWTPAERKRLYVIGVFFLCAALFWSEFEQAGSTLNLFADRATRNSILGANFPSSWFQSANALFIIMFAPVFAWLWITLGSREPSSPIKFAFGLMGVGLGFALLVPAAQAAAPGTLVSPLWLIATYLIHTWAELCLSPVGLSSMTKLAPARVAGLMMGVWFLGASVGNFIGGRLASFYESFPLPSLFAVVAGFGIVFGLLLLVFSKTIKEWMGDVR